VNNVDYVKRLYETLLPSLRLRCYTSRRARVAPRRS